MSFALEDRFFYLGRVYVIPVRHVYFIKHLHRRSADQKTESSD